MKNRTTNKLKAEFEPETRFIVRPAPAAPFRATYETDFDRLKNRLVTETLLATAKPEVNVLIRRAANEAAALAWVTFVPLLMFPALFEEKVRKAVHQAERQARILAHSRDLITV